MKLLLLASGRFSVPSLRWLRRSDHDIVRVVTQPDRPAGRGRRTTGTPVRAAAAGLGLDALPVENVNDPPVVGELLAAGADLALVIAFGQKIGPRLLEGFPKGCLNLHASLLPKYRGAAPINHALLNGERETGLTVFRVIEKMDAGPILSALPVAIESDETAGELHDRLADLGPEILAKTFDLFADGANPPGTPQDETQATPAGRLKKTDGRLDFNDSAASLIRRIRAYTPWPGAACMFISARTGQTEAVLITRARIVDVPSGAVAGAVVSGLTVATGAGGLEILELKPAGSRVMSATDYVNGRHVRPGDQFA